MADAPTAAASQGGTPTEPDLTARASAFFQTLQLEITAGLEVIDGRARFRTDAWTRDGSDPTSPIQGGWGRTMILEGGDVFEKAGVAFSYVYGRFPESYAQQFPGDGLDFVATGVSLVLHPGNPMVPTVHANYRRLSRGSSGWFGGGADLTPYYLDEADAHHFHRVHRQACEAHPGVADYPAFRDACDQYFYLSHRKEARGVGGIFFDHLTTEPESTFAFVQDAGRAFLKAYAPIAERHKDDPFTPEQRNWQLIRRGRYVEFNLVHDRGTLFGLRTGGRIESILMSLPAQVSWVYDHHPAPGSPEAALLDVVRQPRQWGSDNG
jgi:coproporphyrinogen III oxidase